MADTNRQARAEATRSQLVAAARGVFAERGYRGATVAAITERAGTAHGTFYLYFRNREDAFVHVITDVLDDLYRQSFTPIEQLPGQRDPLVLRERIAAFLRACVGHGSLWRALLEGALASPVVEQHWVDERRRFHAALIERFEHFQAHDASARDIDPKIAAYALASMIEWYAVSGEVFGQPQPLEANDHVVDSLTALWVNALAVDR